MQASDKEHDDPVAVSRTAETLVPLLLEDLRKRASHERRRVRAGETLCTTALVHEAYLKLRRGEGWQGELHFLRAAALAMRRVPSWLGNSEPASRIAGRNCSFVTWNACPSSSLVTGPMSSVSRKVNSRLIHFQNSRLCRASVLSRKYVEEIPEGFCPETRRREET